MTDMPWRNPETWGDLFRVVLAFAALISGGVGGAITAGRYLLHRRIDSVLLAVAYIMVGGGIGFGMFALSPLLPGVSIQSFQDAAMYGFVGGVFGTLALAASHVVIRFSAKRLGIEDATVDIKFRDPPQ